MRVAILTVCCIVVAASPWRIVGRHRSWPDGHVDFDHPGVKIVARITGAATVSAVMSKVGSIENVFVVYCDGVAQPGSGPKATFSTKLWTEGTKQSVPLCSGLDANAEHDIVIFKSTEAQWMDIKPTPNHVSFYEIVGLGMRLLPPLVRPQQHRIEFLGDSITAGYCNLCEQEPSPAAESYASSWPTLVCEQLDAECHAVAWSGYGMVKNCCGGDTVMSDIWLRTLASTPSDDASDPHGTTATNIWNFKSWIPDAVVINLGSNDGLTGSREELIPAYNATYLDLVKSAAVAYGEQTHFFLACGPQRNSYCDPVRWIIGQANAIGIKATFLDHRGFECPESCCEHPGADQDRQMAESTVKQVKAAMGWSVWSIYM